MRYELRKASARAPIGDVSGRGWQPSGEAPDVRYADGIGKELEHRRVVRRIADVDHRGAVSVEVDRKLLSEKLARHAELVVVAEPAVDVDRAQLRMQPGLAHQGCDTLRRRQRQRRHVLAIVDREVRFAVSLIGRDGTAGHGGDDGLRDLRQPLAIARTHFGWISVMLLQSPVREEEVKG